jgi:hypothetical protein
VIETLAATAAVCAASISLGQASLALCGVRGWSWISPALGLALLCGICWGTVRLPGHGLASAALVAVLAIAAVALLRGRVERGGEALRVGAPVAFVALAAALLPFLVEGHFGILGTGFNPDMSQHLLATDRLAGGESSQLLIQGYPLGPHAIVASLKHGLGIDLVRGFDGLTIAVAILAPLTAIAAFAEQPLPRRLAAALVVGLPYLVASYYAQGSFKETIQALLVLAFVLCLREASRNPEWRDLPLRYVPAAIIAIGSVCAYSFPGLVWLFVVAGAWAISEWAWGRYSSSAGGMRGGRVEDALARSAVPPPTTGPAGRRALGLAMIVFAVGALPELGRMIDFHSFETFDPNGPGLGNLFGQVSPFTALGIWPSGDFRLAPGDGAAPALAYYVGAAFASLLLVFGLVQAAVRRETAILAGAFTVAAVYAIARVGGTPYTAAKALEVAAPVLSLVIVMAAGRLSLHMGKKGAPAAAIAIYLGLAGGCSLLALANAPVGPTSYSPALTSLRAQLEGGSTLVLASSRLLEEEQGRRYIAWELRGGRVCIEPESAAGGEAPAGIRFFITEGTARPPFRGVSLRRQAGPYRLWASRRPVAGFGPCPLIAVRQARQGAAR